MFAGKKNTVPAASALKLTPSAKWTLGRYMVHTHPRVPIVLCVTILYYCVIFYFFYKPTLIYWNLHTHPYTKHSLCGNLVLFGLLFFHKPILIYWNLFDKFSLIYVYLHCQVNKLILHINFI